MDQLTGEAASDLAKDARLTPTAIRLRWMRARRAASRLCEPQEPIDSLNRRVDQLLRESRRDRLTFARAHIKVAQTYVKLANVQPDSAEKLLVRLEKTVTTVAKALSKLKESVARDEIEADLRGVERSIQEIRLASSKSQSTDA